MLMMEIERFEFNPFEENTYVLSDETRECIIIDPGCADKNEENQLASYIDRHGFKVKLLINTHCHIDHVLGNAFVKDRYKVNLAIHKLELPVLKAVKAYAPNYGFYAYQDAEPDEYLVEGKELRFGNQQLDVLFVPGHSPGHIALYHAGSSSLIGGDVLFRNSIGRTDLPGGNYDVLLSSIHEKLFALPDDVTVYCGHGPSTTIGYEKKTNPFCAIA